MDPYSAHIVASTHREQLMREAEQSRLAAAAREAAKEEPSPPRRGTVPARRPAVA